MIALEMLDDDEDVVDSYGKNEEWQNFDNNQSHFNAGIAEDPKGADNGSHNNQDAHETDGNLGVNKHSRC